MRFLKNVERLSLALVVLWMTGGIGRAEIANGGPISASDQQVQAIDQVSKHRQKQVDLFTGAFGYSIPIACAPARNGSEPNLALVYSSSGDLGWCGMGWNVNIGHIERNVRDGFPIAYSTAAPPAPLTQYDDSKGFILNLSGKESKLFSVATNAGVVEYRAEVDTGFLRCFLDIGNNKWTVYDKSGDVYYFGESAACRVSNPKTGSGWSSGYSGTFHWALDQVATATGDWTTIGYTTYNSERTIYPTQITYNGHTNFNGYSANSTGLHKIIFQTEPRTNDWRFSHHWGFRTEQSQRLTNILCQVGSQNVWSYSLKYGMSPATGRSLLTNVVIYGYNGSSATPFLTNTFAYQASSNGVAFGPTIQWNNLNFNSPGTSSGSYEADVTQAGAFLSADVVDIDGDGLPDRVSWDQSTSPNQYQVQKNLGVQANGNGLFASRYPFGPTSTGPSGVPSASNPLPEDGDYAQLNSKRGRLRDLNGDGLPDRVEDYWWAINSLGGLPINYVAFTNFEVQLNIGQGFSSNASAWPVSTGPLGGSDQNSPWYFCVESGRTNVGLFDINGDGRPDRVMAGWSQWTNLLVQLNTGTNFTQPLLFGPNHNQNWTSDGSWAGIDTDEVHMMDLNGDGLPDRVMRPMDPSHPGSELPHLTNSSASYFALEFNDGYSFESTNASTSVPGASDQWPGVVAQANNGAWSYQGITFWSDAIWDLPFGGLFDLNGDGLPDRVLLDQTTLNTANTAWLVYLNNGHGFNSTPVRVTGIENQGHYALSTDAPWWSPQGFLSGYGNVTTLIDINGDGLLDRVLGVYYSGTPTANYFLVQMNTGPFPDLLTNIDNGIGGNIGVSYKSSTAYDNRVDPTSSNSVSHMPFPRHVTAAATESDGINAAQTTTYSYSGGFYDGVRREFHGFAVVTNTDPTLRKTVTYFHTGGGRNYSALGEYQDTNSTTGNFAKAGMAYRVETYGNDNELYHVQIAQVDQASLGNGRYFPFTTLSFDCDYPGNGTPNVTATDFIYDTSTGNLTNKIEYGKVTGFDPANTDGFSFGDADPTDTRYFKTHFTAIGTYIVDHPDQVRLTDGSNNTIQETDYSYNSGGTLATKLTRISAGYNATNSYGSYNTYGLAGLKTDPVGVQTTITYESTYNTYPATTRLRAVPGSDSGSDFITTTTFDARSGQLAVATDPAGLTVSNSFDLFLRPTEVDKIPIGGSPIWVTKISYPAALNRIVSGVAINYVDALVNDGVGGLESRTYIDGFGRPIQTRTLAENTSYYRVVSTAYDGRGNAFLTTWPVFLSGATFSKPVSGTATWIGYDAAGRVATNRAYSVSFDSNGAFSSKAVPTDDTGSPLAARTWSYVNGTDPWWIICTDEDLKVRRYGLDGFGRTNQIVEVDGGSTYTTTLKYDLANNLTNIVNANLENIYWAYNDAGGVVAMADPYLGVWTNQLDYAGRLRVQTDARGNVVSNSYINPSGYQDPLGRLQVRTVFSRIYSNNTLVPAYTNIYTYDSSDDGNFTLYKGLLYKVTDREGWEKTGYDSRERVIKATRHLNLVNRDYTNRYTFDDGNNVTSIAYPNSGPTITNVYFHGGSINQVSRFGDGAYYTVSASAFDEFGHITQFAYGNGLTTARSYYSISKRLQSISCGAVFSRSFTYSSGEDILSLAGTGISGTVNATYDNLHRIKTYTGLSGSYGYDPTGNITTDIEGGGSSYTYANPRKQAVRTAFGYTNLYDLCGNMIVRHGGTSNSQAMVYDPENRLSAIAQAGVMSDEFGYSADGTRLWKRINQHPTNIQVWIGKIYEEKAGKVLYHVFAGGQQVCTFETNSPLAGGADTSKVGYYYHEDNLNTSSALSGSSGSQLEVNVYYPFGRTQTATPQASFQVSRRFTGQVFDTESGLYYYNARYYDPELGRFIQPDDVIPDLSNPQSYNRYSYVLNNPLRFNDPSGHINQQELDDLARKLGESRGKDWGSYAEAAHDLKIPGYEIQSAGNIAGVAAVGHTAAKAADAYVNIVPGIAELGVGTAVSAGAREAAEHAPGMMVKLFGGGAKNFTKELGVSEGVARAHLRAALEGTGGQAHHIIPWEMRNNELIKRAAEGGFNINGVENGIRLGQDVHFGSHPKYNAAVESKLNSMLRANPNISPPDAAAAARDYANQLRNGLERTERKLQ